MMEFLYPLWCDRNFSAGITVDVILMGIKMTVGYANSIFVRLCHLVWSHSYSHGSNVSVQFDRSVHLCFIYANILFFNMFRIRQKV